MHIEDWARAAFLQIVLDEAISIAVSHKIAHYKQKYFPSFRNETMMFFNQVHQKLALKKRLSIEPYFNGV